MFWQQVAIYLSVASIARAQGSIQHTPMWGPPKESWAPDCKLQVVDLDFVLRCAQNLRLERPVTLTMLAGNARELCKARDLTSGKPDDKLSTQVILHTSQDVLYDSHAIGKVINDVLDGCGHRHCRHKNLNCVYDGLGTSDFD
jgi:hypothetical protein